MAAQVNSYPHDESIGQSVPLYEQAMGNYGSMPLLIAVSLLGQSQPFKAMQANVYNPNLLSPIAKKKSDKLLVNVCNLVADLVEKFKASSLVEVKQQIARKLIIVTHSFIYQLKNKKQYAKAMDSIQLDNTIPTLQGGTKQHLMVLIEMELIRFGLSVTNLNQEINNICQKMNVLSYMDRQANKAKANTGSTSSQGGGDSHDDIKQLLMNIAKATHDTCAEYISNKPSLWREIFYSSDISGTKNEGMVHYALHHAVKILDNAGSMEKDKRIDKLVQNLVICYGFYYYLSNIQHNKRIAKELKNRLALLDINIQLTNDSKQSIHSIKTHILTILNTVGISYCEDLLQARIDKMLDKLQQWQVGKLDEWKGLDKIVNQKITSIQPIPVLN